MQAIDYTKSCGIGTLNLEITDITKDEKAFNEAILALKNSDFIRFSGNITNEEAQFLQALKSTFGKKLISEWSYQFKDFLENFLTISSTFANEEDIKIADTILIFGTKLDADCKELVTLISNKKIALLHPMQEHDLDVKQFIKYEPSSEDAVSALLAFALCDKSKLNPTQKKYIENLDDGFLSGEASFDETEQEELLELINSANNTVLIAGADLYFHKNSALIAKLLGVLSNTTDIKIMFLPPEINSFGVIKYCDLDISASGFGVGFEAFGDFVVSSKKNQNNFLQIPSFYERNGTYIDFYQNTQIICNKTTNFYQIADFIDTAGIKITQNEQQLKPKTTKEHYDEIESINEMNGALLYFCGCQNLSQNSDIIMGSKSFAAAAKVADKKSYMATFNNCSLNVTFNLETNMKGTIAIMPPKSPGYRFVPVVMREV